MKTNNNNNNNKNYRKLGQEKKSRAFQWIFMKKKSIKKSFIVNTCNTKHIENKSYTALEKNTATGYLKYLKCIYTWWWDEL